MAKHKTPLLDQLESGPWPSFVSDIKQEIESRYKNPKGIDFQVPAECPDDLLGILELSYVEGETHWKHGGIVGVLGYGGGDTEDPDQRNKERRPAGDQHGSLQDPTSPVQVIGSGDHVSPALAQKLTATELKNFSER